MKIILVERAEGAKPFEIPLENYVLNSSYLVKIDGDFKDISNVERQGLNLVIVLVSGKKITLYNFYKHDEEGEHSELVVDDQESGLLWLNHDLEFVEISSGNPPINN